MENYYYAIDALIRAIDALASGNPAYAAQETEVARHYLRDVE